MTLEEYRQTRCPHGWVDVTQCEPCKTAAERDALRNEVDRLRVAAQDVTELVDALEHYANPDNWQEDFEGVPRTWLEPDSDTRNEYSGFELAAKALSKYKGAK
jgi:hypothetical protein